MNEIQLKVKDFINKYGLAPNTLLVGPDHKLANFREIMGMPVKVCDAINLEVALL